MPMGMGGVGGDSPDKKIPQAPSAEQSGSPQEKQKTSGAGTKDDAKSFMSYVKQTLFNSELFESRGEIVSNSSGRVKHMLFQYNSNYFAEQNRDDVLKAYKILIDEMEQDTKFTIIARDNADAYKLKKFIEKIKPVNPGRIKIVEANTYISIWARDLIISVLSDKNQPEVVMPQSDRKEYITGKEAMKKAGLQYDYSDLAIEGGNIQRDKDGNIWVGDDAIKVSGWKLFEEIIGDKDLKDYFKRYWKKLTGEEMPEDFHSCEKEIRKIIEEKIIPEMIKRQFNLAKDKELYIIGKDNPETKSIAEEQPAFHIDMAVTPLGDKTVIIGDPGLAMSIIQNNKPQCLEDGKRMWVEQLSGNQPNLGGFYAAEVAFPAGPQLGIDINIVDALVKENSKPEIKRNFDATVKEFEDKGFKVIRVPYLQGITPKEPWRPSNLPFVSYNNCIMEEYTNDKGEKLKKVYLPQYGIKALDDYASDTFAKLGFKVIKIPSMAFISRKQGSIHCIVNDLERTNK